MVAIQSILLAATCATTALAAPSEISKRQWGGGGGGGGGETITTSQTGMTGDYFYTHWAENDAGASMTLNGNSYSLDWSQQSGNIVSGIGWATGSARYDGASEAKEAYMTNTLQRCLLRGQRAVQRQLVPDAVRLDPKPAH